MSDIVLDASAVLAVAKREPGADAVLQARAQAIISAVNHAEVVSKLLRSKIPPEAINPFLEEVFPRVVAFDREQADVAARLHAQSRPEKLSYADCACLALAATRGIPVLTGDGKWNRFAADIEIRLFR